METKKNKVPAVNFIGTVLANVDNDDMTDGDFRKFMRDTLPIVEKPELDQLGNPKIREKIKKYY